MLRVLVLTVPGVATARERRALTAEIETLDGVESASVNLDTKNVTVRGYGLDRSALRAAVERAGHRAA